MPDDLKLILFKVAQFECKWTVVAAYSEDHARKVASQLCPNDWESGASFGISEISSPEEIPAGWHNLVPHHEPVKDHLYRTATCEQIIANVVLSGDSEEQHAIDQQLHGAIILRGPVNRAEVSLFEKFGILRTSGNIYFTTLKPLPKELRSFYVCYAMRPELFPAD